MNKKRRMAQDKLQGFIELDAYSLAALYAPKRVVIDQLLNQLEDMRNEYIEQALETSNYEQAKQVIDHIKNK